MNTWEEIELSLQEIMDGAIVHLKQGNLHLYLGKCIDPDCDNPACANTIIVSGFDPDLEVRYDFCYIKKNEETVEEYTAAVAQNIINMRSIAAQWQKIDAAKNGQHVRH